LPTLAELGSSTSPPGIKIDGHSFVPTLLGKPGRQREWAFSQLGHERLVRDERFLLHQDARLYEIDRDPSETNDLGKNSDPEVVAAKKKLEQVLEGLK
jgi:hypothetical protein